MWGSRVPSAECHVVAKLEATQLCKRIQDLYRIFYLSRTFFWDIVDFAAAFTIRVEKAKGDCQFENKIEKLLLAIWIL